LKRGITSALASRTADAAYDTIAFYAVAAARGVSVRRTSGFSPVSRSARTSATGSRLATALCKKPSLRGRLAVPVQDPGRADDDVRDVDVFRIGQTSETDP